MDDRETELSRFRQQWQAEVTARTQPTPGPSTTTTTHTARPAPFAPRRLSHREPVPESDSDDEGGAARAEFAPLQRERSTSPQATRRSAQAPASALEHYEKAVERETQGSLGESLSLYRKAFRMDAKVDSQYREKYYPRPTPGAHPTASAGAGASTSTTAAAATPASQGQPPASIAALIESFAHLAIPPAGTEDTVVYSPFTTLPHELLLHILHTLATTDIASFARCAKVCKALSYVVSTEEAIWRDVCTSAFAKMAWDWRVSVDGTPLIRRVLGGENDDSLLPPTTTTTPAVPEVEAEEIEQEEEEQRPVPDDEAHLPKYGGSWRAMFQSRPRIRFNGVYISTCNYVRQGASQSGWNTPVHIVTYYRYLRFYDDGTVLSLLTSCEPSEVVYGFSRTGVQGGGAAVVAGGAGTGVLPSAVAKKLAWEGFWSWNRVSDDLAEFSLRNDKAFIFSRVGSIERELGLS
ncbi:uncharacterized protein LAJ45_00161 [Morchella importuna]|uniref:uncharacterized protein n=1 Tax=Morchella importuna TaxID=1174673 RepID=UPI001E8CB93C|nr:uncharacterized protein LAJ45_00161 [Morchella importuna]KAH8155152.1 hypothetical protein LAJ45_00161 [Morchella importuna]